MQKHETIIVLKPDLTEDERNKIIQLIIDKVNEKGKIDGEIEQKEKRLASTVKDYNKGYYIEFQFYMQTSLVKEIEIFLRKPQILKYIIAKVVG